MHSANNVKKQVLRQQQISDLGEKNDVSGRLRLGFGLRLLLFLEFVECLDDAEQHEGGDQEVDDRLNECADHELCASDSDRQLGEIDPSDSHSDDRSDHVINERCDDISKCAADDDADCHVHYISSCNELFEFFHESTHVAFSSFVKNY